MDATSPSKTDAQTLVGFSISLRTICQCDDDEMARVHSIFDFHLKHIPGNKNGGADALSRHDQGSTRPSRKTRMKQTITSMPNYIRFKPPIKAPIGTPILSQQEFICTMPNTKTMISSLDLILKPCRDQKA